MNDQASGDAQTRRACSARLPAGDALWVANWQRASVRLEALRAEELARVDVAQAIEALEEPFQSALRQIPPSSTSGLVEQQTWFMKGRR